MSESMTTRHRDQASGGIVTDSAPERNVPAFRPLPHFAANPSLGLREQWGTAVAASLLAAERRSLGEQRAASRLAATTRLVSLIAMLSCCISLLPAYAADTVEQWGMYE